MTYYLFINGNIVKGQKDEPITIETYLGGFILSAVFIDKILINNIQLILIPHTYYK